MAVPTTECGTGHNRQMPPAKAVSNSFGCRVRGCKPSPYENGPRPKASKQKCGILGGTLFLNLGLLINSNNLLFFLGGGNATGVEPSLAFRRPEPRDLHTVVMLLDRIRLAFRHCWPPWQAMQNHELFALLRRHIRLWSTNDETAPRPGRLGSILINLLDRRLAA